MLNPSSPLLHRYALAVALALPMLGACNRSETGAAPQAAAASASNAAPQTEVAPPPPAAERAGPETGSLLAGFPAGFNEYAATAFDGDRQCVVGAASSADDPAQRPYVAVKRASDGDVLWAQALSGIEGMYQARATHCAYAGGSLHVLLQSDTHSQQTLSQTQLSVARVPAGGGEAVSRYVEVPGTRDRAYSAWVDPGEGNFAVRDGQLFVRGHYRFNDEPDAEHDFEVAIDLD